MRALTIAAALLTLAGCAENSAIARAIRGGPPQSEAVALAAEQFSCDPSTLRTEQLGHDVRIRGCGQTAVYGRARDGWVIGLRHRDAGWIVGKDYHQEDLEVFSRAVDDLDCAPYEVVLERRNGIRIAKGCGAERAYAVVCGEEIRELAVEELPRVGAWRQMGTPHPPEPSLPPPPLPDAQVSGRAIPFRAGMTRPERVCGRSPRYSEVALASGSKGLMIVRCLLGTDGLVSACDVIKGLDVHNAVVLDALYSHRYTPVTLEGRPIAVDYVFNILIR